MPRNPKGWFLVRKWRQLTSGWAPHVEDAVPAPDLALPRSPDDLDLLRCQADSLAALGRIEEAESVYRELTARHPKHPAGFLGLVRSAANQQEHTVVLERCERFGPRFPGTFAFARFKLRALLALERHGIAEQICRELIRAQHKADFAYLILARIALAQGEHHTALQYAGNAIELRPSAVGNYQAKGTALLELSRLQEARQVFEGMVQRFPQHVSGHIGLYRAFRKLEEHTSALSEIRKAYEIDSSDQTVLHCYAMALEMVGRVEEGIQLLEHHVHQLDEDLCVLPLVDLYSVHGKTSKVLELMETKRESFVRHPDLQIKAGLALRNRGNLSAAYVIFQGYLDLEMSPTLANLKHRFRVYGQLRLLHAIQRDQHLFKHYALRSLSLPRPYLYKDGAHQHCIELLEKGDFREAEKLSGERSEKDAPDNVATFNRLVAYHSERLSQLAGNYGESYLEIGVSPSSMVQLARKMVHKIQHRIPASMIRLGDGEGSFLEYASAYKDWQDADREANQRIWWGEIRFKERDTQRITQLLHETISNADILGVPDLTRMVRSLNNFENRARTTGARGLMAIFNHLSSQQYLNEKSPDCILASCHFHTDMEFWGIYRYVLTCVERVTLITCFEQLAQVVADRFGIASVDVILIPSEYRQSRKFETYRAENDHYPYHFDRILAELSVKPGELFLVAAGLLGKIYCNEIKKRGGIGIDIGSAADVWLGYSTRVEHEYSRSVGVNLDFDSLRKETFPAYKKVVPKPYYRSNYYADMNIYREPAGGSIEVPSLRKRLLIIGHPRCGSRYLSLVLRRMGLDINHKRFGSDGMCSWLFAVKDLNAPNFGKYSDVSPDASYRTEFDHIAGYVRDPFAAIPSIMVENRDRDDRSYNFRRNHIIRELGIDIDEYTSDLERAVASYLFWYRIVQARKPSTIFRVEDCVSDVHSFLLERDLIGAPVDISGIEIAKNANATALRGIVKPIISRSDYSTIASHLKEELDSFCEIFGY